MRFYTIPYVGESACTECGTLVSFGTIFCPECERVAELKAEQAPEAELSSEDENQDD